jgi:signal transduction histidine kinase
VKQGGLRNLRHRAERLGGELTAPGDPGAGTRIVWTLPV